MPTDPALPVRRFTLASWLSIYGRHCYQDFVKETDYAALEKESAKLQRYVDFVERHADPDIVRGARMDAEQITEQDIAETMPPKP